jgi:lipoate-protein ligase A
MRGPVVQEADAAFLCFGRGDPRDILCQGHKIVGSAQRRRRGAVLQHGSILWARSPYAPRFPGILDLCSGISPMETMAGEFAGEVAAILAPEEIQESLSEIDAERAKILEQERYCRLDWRPSRRREGLISTDSSSQAEMASDGETRCL